MKKTVAFCAIFLSLIIISCQQKSDTSFRFVFMTDIHLTYDRNAPEGFKSALNTANALKPRPDFILSGGDLIMDALDARLAAADSQFTLLENSLMNNPLPFHYAAGNHEFFGVYKRSEIKETHPMYGSGLFLQRSGLEKPYYSFDHKNWHFIILNSIGITEDRRYTGMVDSLQIEWLRDDVLSTPENTNIAIVTHIPLVSVAAQMASGPDAPNNIKNMVANAQQVISILNQRNFRLALQGHLHVVEGIEWKNTLYVTGGSVCGAWWNGPNYEFEEGFVVVDINGNDIDWQYIDYGWQAGQ